MTQVSKSQCIQLRSNPGYYLLEDAAFAWDRASVAFGKAVLITGAWRSYQTQVELFDSELYPNTGRYVRGNHAGQRGYTTDVRGRTADGGLYRGSWWTRKEGTAAAAVPGTSNHGGGVAVDAKTRREDGDPSYDVAVIFSGWNDADRARFLRVAAEHGWYDDEGRGVGEHWHLTYYPARDQHRGEKPKMNLLEEPDMDTTQAKQLSETRALVGELKTLLGGRVKAEGSEEGLLHDTAHEWEIKILRRVEANQIAAKTMPVTVDVDAEDLADAFGELLKALPAATAKAVLDGTAARLKS